MSMVSDEPVLRDTVHIDMQLLIRNAASIEQAVL
jgi:hypothetical protein